VNPRFTGKVVVIIGGNSGIGLASAKAFASEGAHVVITGRNAATLQSAAEEIGSGAIAIQSDIADIPQITSLMDEVQRRHGRVDVLFVNAGIGAFLPIEKVTERDWEEIIGVNLKGVFFTVQKALPMMKAGGSIVITSSIGGRMGIPTNSVYAASKAGLNAFNQSLAKALAPRGVYVFVVAPGWVATPRVADAVQDKAVLSDQPLGRVATPDEVAQVIRFCALDAPASMTGAILDVNGASYLRS